MTSLKFIATSIVALSLLANYAFAETTYEPAEYQPLKRYTASEPDSSTVKQNSPELPAMVATETAQTSSETLISPVSEVSLANPPDKATEIPANQPTTNTTAAIVDDASSSAVNELLYPGILVLVVVCIGWAGKMRTQTVGTSNTVSPAQPTAITGVERYLRMSNLQKTGVEKYLENQAKTASLTGVAKYLAKQVVKERNA